MEARNRANIVLGFNASRLKNRSVKVILKLYLALVRTHLKYPPQFWFPYYRMDIGWLQSFQRKMTQMTDSMSSFTYKSRLKLLHLHSLKKRREIGDLTEVFKWFNSYNKGNVRKIL